MTPTAPYAMVQAGSSDWRVLRALGWTTTDVPPGADAAEGEWHHLEPPPGGSKLLGVDSMMVITAPDLPDSDIEALRDAVDAALQDPDFALVSAAEVNIEILPIGPEAGDGQWDVVATRRPRRG